MTEQTNGRKKWTPQQQILVEALGSTFEEHFQEHADGTQWSETIEVLVVFISAVFALALKPDADPAKLATRIGRDIADNAKYIAAHPEKNPLQWLVAGDE